MKKLLLIGLCIILLSSFVIADTSNDMITCIACNTSTADESIFGLTVHVNGTPEVVTGHIGDGLYFDGSSEYITIHDNAVFDALDGGSATFHIDFWVQTNTSGGAGWQADFFQRRPASGDPVINFNPGTGDALSVYLSDGSQLDSNSPNVSDNTMQFVSLDKNGTEFKFYVDDALVHTEIDAWDLTANPGYISFMATLYNGLSAGNWVMGTIDEITIWNISLSLQNVTSRYNSGAGLPCPNAFNGPPAPPTPTINVNITTPSNDTVLGIINLSSQSAIYINGTHNNDSTTSCTINDTNRFTPATATAPSNYSFINITDFPNGNYFFSVQCNRSGNSNGTAYVNFTIDISDPIITPLDVLVNNNTVVYNGTLSTEINLSDNREIYSINATLTNGTVIFNVTNFGYSLYYLNISYGVDDTVSNNLTIRVCDAHTNKEIKEVEKISYKKGGVKYYIVDNLIPINEEWIHIYPKDYGDYETAESEKLKDRYSPTFNKKNSPKSTETFVIESSHYVDIAKLQLYGGHAVIPHIGDNGWWADIEIDEAEAYIVRRIDNNKLEIDVYGLKSKKIKSKSVGELNCNNASYPFANINPVESYSGSVIEGDTAIFYLNITEDPITMDSVNATLYYNNTAYYGGTSSNFSVSVTVPDIDGLELDIPFNWIIEVDGIEYNLTTHNQTVSNILIDNCSNASYLTYALNVTFLDTDGNSDSVNTSISITGDGDYFASFGNVSNFSICIHPHYANYSESVSIQYGSASILYYTYSTYLNNQTQLLTLYTQEGSSTTIFTIKDQDSPTTLLENVYSTMYRRIGGVWTVIESKYSDITGRVQFSYVANVEYRFFLTLSGYVPTVFNLNPILYSEYDVLMEKNTTLNTSQDYDRVGLYYYTSPRAFYNNRSHNFSFMIHSPYSELLGYGYNLTYPGGTSSNLGTTDIGELLESTFNISGAVSGDRVTLYYYYITDVAGHRNFTKYYDIGIQEGNYTMVSNRDRTYGLGLFERLLVAVLIVLFVVGIAAMIGKPTPGAALGMGIYGYLVYIGFIPLWSVLITIAIGLIIIGSRPEG